jgi:hypothetical protein
VIITKGELGRQDFFELMGVTNKSPLAPIFDTLYDRLIKNMIPISEKFSYWEHAQGKDLEKQLEKDFSEQVAKKMIEAKNNGNNVYVGTLSSEEEIVESFFCCDSFEIENNKIYFNGLECVW